MPSRLTGIPDMAITNPFQFLQQVRAEVSKVVWPTRQETLQTTVMVSIVVLITANNIVKISENFLIVINSFD